MTQRAFEAADSQTADFYDNLAATYTTQFADWNAASDRQAEALDRCLRRVCADGRGSVLDTACGIGTQAIGLARRGYQVHGTDISAASIEQAALNASAAGVKLRLDVVDFRDLSALPTDFDAVICCDNALPHLLTDAEMLTALGSMRARVRPGGMVLITVRDYDQARRERSGGQPPRVFTDRDGRERMVLQIWRWQTDDVYDLRHVMLTREGTVWSGAEHNARYRAIMRSELADLVLGAGLSDPQWLMPHTSGFYQPILVAHVPDGQA